ISATARAAVAMCSRCARISTTPATMKPSHPRAGGRIVARRYARARVARKLAGRPAAPAAGTALVRPMNAQHLQPYRRTTARAHAALLLMVLIWGINFPIAKSALTQLDPLA